MRSRSGSTGFCSESQGIVFDPASSFALAERVAIAARTIGIETALIGASALAVHNHVRATSDLDLGCSVEPYSKLAELEQALVADGIRTALRLPDEDDPLGGVLVAWEREDDQAEPLGPVELVNFLNPHRPRPNPARLAIERAVALDDGGALRCVRLPDLIALKVYAGSRQDLADVVELLLRNPDANREEIRATASPYDPTGQLEQLITEAAVRLGRPS